MTKILLVNSKVVIIMLLTASFGTVVTVVVKGFVVVRGGVALSFESIIRRFSHRSQGGTHYQLLIRVLRGEHRRFWHRLSTLELG